MSSPLVSICLPIYNGAAFLREAMDGVIAQTYENLEIVVSDDQSKDDSLAIIESYRVKTSIPIHIHSHTPSGIGANWNNCVKEASGKYIKFVFQDDLITKDCVAKMVAVAETDDNVGLVFSTRTILYDEGNSKHVKWMSVCGTLHDHWGRLHTVNDGKTLLKNAYLLNRPRNKIGEPSVTLIRKSVFDRIGYFDVNLRQVLDYEFYYRMMPYYRIGFLDEKLASFRLHDLQATAVNSTDEARISYEKKFVRKMFYDDMYKYLHPWVKLKLKREFHPLESAIYRLKRGIRSMISGTTPREL